MVSYLKPICICCCWVLLDDQNCVRAGDGEERHVQETSLLVEPFGGWETTHTFRVFFWSGVMTLGTPGSSLGIVNIGSMKEKK